ncbi:polysaccharide deacetylase family protein [Roseomonas elaeocarpi]|uniref:Chitooligosaccharide deacetylase n=1 Tax=Roseomonas elaeocarpi TaxID=907779 RepID=A0ABV6JMS9_9PROT
MTYEVQRDFRGYGGHPPDPRWPGGARVAVNFVINFEEGSEPSIADGDAATETGVSDAAGPPRGIQGRDLAAEGMFEYGSRAGFWRLLRIFAERGLKPTIFACALALERNPEAAAAIREAGLDICCHGWRWENHFALSEAEERDRIARAVASLERTLGQRPEGWYCRYGPSVNTRRLLREHGGFLYDSDSYADDLPFWTEVGGQGHLVVPYSLATNDSKMQGPLASPGAWASFLSDGFDLLRREGRAGAPKMMSVGLHMRMIGHFSRAPALERFLDHVLAAGDEAWVAPRAEIARHWAATHPFRDR